MISSFIKKHLLVIAVGAVAIVMVASLSVGSAMSYFTATAQAENVQTINMRTTTSIQEQVVNGAKLVTIESEGPSDCFVRARAYAGGLCQITYDGSDGGAEQQWFEGVGTDGQPDGWWYCSKVLLADSSTPRLKVGIQTPVESTDDFNVVVTYETTVVSNADGSGGIWPDGGHGSNVAGGEGA